MSVVPPLGLGTGAPLCDALEVVRTLDEALAAVPGETELQLLVLAVSAGVPAVADRAGWEAAALRAGTRNVVLVITNLRAGAPHDDQHTCQLYHICCLSLLFLILSPL